MTLVTGIDDALQTDGEPAVGGAQPWRGSAFVTQALQSVSASSPAPLAQTIGDRGLREGMQRVLAYISPAITRQNTLTSAEDSELDAMLLSGQRHRAAAETLLQEKQAAERSFSWGPPLSRRQSYWVGGMLLLSGMLRVFGKSDLHRVEPLSHAQDTGTAASSGGGDTQASEAVYGPARADAVSAWEATAGDAALRGMQQHDAAPTGRRRVRREAQGSTKAAQLLDKIYEIKKLPSSDKQRVIDPLLERYNESAQQDNENSQEHRLMTLDRMANALSETSGVLWHHYQSIRQGLRNRLEAFRHQTAVNRYLEETAPSFSIVRTPRANEKLFAAYFNASDPHSLMLSLSRGMDSEYLDALILEVCNKHFRGITDYISMPPLNQTHRVMFDATSVTGRLILLPKYFTTKEIFLGVHQRQVLTQGAAAFFFPENTDLFLRFAVERTPNITDFIDRALKALLVKLEENKRFKSVFESTVYFRAIGVVITALEANPQLADTAVITRFLRREVSPQHVTLWDKTVPNLVAISESQSSDIVYISLAFSEVRVFAREQYKGDINVFIAKHLSLFDRQRLQASSLKPKRVCHGLAHIHIANTPVCLDNPLCVKYDNDYPQTLYQALLVQIQENIDSLTYTNDEYQRHLNLAFAKGVFEAIGIMTGILSVAATGPFSAAVMASIGLGAGVGEVIINQRIAESTDNGMIYHQAVEHAQLGMWFIALGVMVDVPLSGKAIVNRFKTFRKSRVPVRADAAVPRRRAKTFGRKPDQKKGPPVPDSAPQNAGPAKMGGKKPTELIYKDSPTFREVKKSLNPAIGSAGYRTIGDNHYALFYTKVEEGAQTGGRTLLVSAHGGFFNVDRNEQAVALPAHLTVKMLAPHGTFLEDPTLRRVANAEINFQSFLTIKNGEARVHFRPQDHADWRHGPQYDPHLPRHALGLPDGLQNYRHYHFERESPSEISDVLIENRWLALFGQATPSDILVVHDKIAHFRDTNIAKASVGRVIELDSNGELVNVLGERYTTIIFSHCRANFFAPEWLTSTYKAVYPHPYDLRRPRRSARLVRTTLYRENVTMPFQQRDEELGEVAFYPVASNVSVTSNGESTRIDPPVTAGGPAASEVSR